MGVLQGKKQSSVSVGTTFFSTVCFWTSRCPWLQDRPVKKPCKCSKNWLRRASIKSYLTSKIGHIKLSNYKATAQITRVFRAKAQINAYAVLERHVPKFSIRVLYESCRPDDGGCCFLGNLGFFQAQISRTKQNDQTSGVKKANTVTDGRGLTEHVCAQNCRICLRKTTWYSDYY